MESCRRSGVERNLFTVAVIRNGWCGDGDNSCCADPQKQFLGMENKSEGGGGLGWCYAGNCWERSHWLTNPEEAINEFSYCRLFGLPLVLWGGGCEWVGAAKFSPKLPQRPLCSFQGFHCCLVLWYCRWQWVSRDGIKICTSEDTRNYTSVDEFTETRQECSGKTFYASIGFVLWLFFNCFCCFVIAGLQYFLFVSFWPTTRALMGASRGGGGKGRKNIILFQEDKNIQFSSWTK